MGGWGRGFGEGGGVGLGWGWREGVHISVYRAGIGKQCATLLSESKKM